MTDIHAVIPKEFVPFSCAPYSLYKNDKTCDTCCCWGVVGLNHAGEYVFFVRNVPYEVAMFCLHALATSTDSVKFCKFTDPITQTRIDAWEK